MIRAVVSQGMFKPIDPVPEDWAEGAEVVVACVTNAPPNHAEIDDWYNAYAAQDSPVLSPEEEARFDQTLAELKADSKRQFDRVAELNN